MKFPGIISSQRWAAGAACLALVFACSPQSPGAPEPAQPAPQGGPQLSAAPVNAKPAIIEAPPPVPIQNPGYAGMWASSEAECMEPLKASEFSGETISYKPEKAECQVKSLSEETPTGRSMIYTIEAECTVGGQPSHETIKLNFGASDTVMQMVVGKRKPVRLVRCP